MTAFANEWHTVHLGSRAVGGAALVFTEAAAVCPEGRISPADLGIYRDEHITKLREIVQFIHDRGAVAGIQLAHAGFASTAAPWDGGGPLPISDGGWRPIYAPSAVPFRDDWIGPQALTMPEILQLTQTFVDAARRAVAARFRVVEIHAAHGYLLHEFLSPITNGRTDRYGGSFESRTRLLREVVAAIRQMLPDELPLFVRISASDWTAGGWSIDESVRLATALKELGVDLIDASSGGILPHADIPVGPGYQVPFASRIRRESKVATGAVGMITDPSQAQSIIENGDADIVLLARQLLRDPYWPLHAAQVVGGELSWPRQ